MADVNPQPAQSNTPNTTPAPQGDKDKIGTFVERLRSYETDVAHLQGIKLEPKVEFQGDPLPTKGINIKQPRPDPYQIAGNLGPTVQSDTTTIDALDAANTVVEPQIPKEDPQKAVEALHKEDPIPKMRTIQTDLIDNAKAKQTTVENIIVQEQLKSQAKVVVEDPKRSFYLLGLSGILILAGLIALGVYYILRISPRTEPKIELDTKSIIVTDSAEEMAYDENTPFADQLAVAQRRPVGARNQLVRLAIKQGTSTIDAQTFVSAFSETIPTWLVRSFNPEYLVGFYSSQSRGWQPVMIFKLNSYDNGYAGMLKWEETMGEEYARFVPAVRVATSTASSTVIATSTATSTKTSKPVATKKPTTTPEVIEAPAQEVENPILNTGFKDVIIKNKDVRVLEDTNNRRVLMYSFIDTETLVITTEQSALEEIIARYTTSKFVR